MTRRAPRAPRVTSQRLVTLVGIACLFAAIMPVDRGQGILRWWWQRDPATAFGGITALLALPLLLFGSFSARGHSAATSGALLAALSAAAWALALPTSTGAVLVVASSFALVGVAAEWALARAGSGEGPDAVARASPLRWWSLGAGAAACAISILALATTPRHGIDLGVGIGAGASGAFSAIASGARFRARRPASIAAVALALFAAACMIIDPIAEGRRGDAVAAGRVVMLLVTTVAALAALLAGRGAAGSTIEIEPAARFGDSA